MHATCYDKLGNMAEAIEAYQKFIELDHGRDDAQDFQARQRVAFLRRKLEGKKR
jgi:tetratricopeptide (TPR) repeat protein